MNSKISFTTYTNNRILQTPIIMNKHSLFSLICLFGMLLAPMFLFSANDSLMMYIPPGQVKGNYLEVYIFNEDITPGMHPTLTLERPKRDGKQTFKAHPDKIFLRQAFVAEAIKGRDDIKVIKSATLILFNISEIDIPVTNTSFKVIASLSWTEAGTGHTARIKYPTLYFIGNGIGTAMWTVLCGLVFLLVVWLILKLKGINQFIGLITDEDGRVSMSLVQMGLWTLAVGLMILAFGLLRLDVPNIPNTLIMLMTFAAVTTTAGQFQSKVKMKKEKEVEVEQEKNESGPERVLRLEKEQEENDRLNSFWYRLGTVFYTNKDSEYPSIAKVQVLFWTVITLSLFIYLSINENELWEIPPELVVLMGISQATFLSRQQMAIGDEKDKLTELEKKGNASQPPANPPATPTK